MAIHSQRNTNRRRHASPRRTGVLSTLGRVLIAAGLSSGALVAVAAASQTPASATGFPPDAFINIDGNIQYVPNAIPPTNQFGWANSGTPATGCSGGPAGAVHLSGSNGLYDCGAPNPLSTASKNFVPLAPKYIGPAAGVNGVLAQQFITSPTPTDWVDCGSGTSVQGSYSLPGGTKFSSGLSQLGINVGTSVPPKDAVADAYVISRINTAGQVEAYFGAQRTANNGDSHVDFQFLQDKVGLVGNCTSGYTFTGSREQGDLLVDTNYVNGGGTTTPNVFTWQCPGSPAIGTKCDTTGSWALQNPPINVAIEHSNSGVIPCGGWVCENGGAGAQQVDSNEFVEGAINLGNLHFGIGCASSLFVETSSSQSGSSQLKAVAKPTTFSDCFPTTTQTTPSSKSIQLGASLTDSATVTGPSGSTVSPAGSVKFYVCTNTTAGCDPASGTPLTGTLTSPNPALLTPVVGTNQSTATSPSFTPLSAGNYCFAGVFTPDTTVPAGQFIKGSSDTSIDECFVVNPLTPGFTTSPTSPQITFGGGNTDTASVIGNSIGGVPTGSVQFYLCQVSAPAATCSGGTAVGSPVALVAPTSGFTSTAKSPSVSPAPGNWCFNASYTAASGGNYTSVSAETNGPNECFTVAKQGTQTATHVVAAQVTFGAGGISDNVSVAPVSNTGPAPTGTVQFYVCETSSTFCTPSPTSQDGAAVGLTVPASGSTSTATSPVFSPTSAGTWCFSAIYSGDNNYLGSQDNTTSTNTDSNECVTVGKAPTATTTTVMDVANNGVWGGETTGASAYDTATVAPNPNFANAPTPTGTISYTFFSNGSCSTAAGPGSAAGTGLPLGTKSNNEGPLKAGSYSFRATYSGDGNYAGSTGACEPFTVLQGTSTTRTVVFDSGTKAPWSGTETTGASAYDTSSVTPSSSLIAAGGTISYTFFSNGSCSPAGPGSAAGTGLPLGTNSSTEGPLNAGSYSFQAVYSGDANYAGSTGTCEPLTVGPGTSTTATVVYDATTSAPWSGQETTGASAYDTATVTPSFVGIAPTGTISYSFFTGSGCSGQSVSAGGGKVGSASATEGPLGAGDYSFQAAYSGDGNYAASTGPCENFSVLKGSSGVATTVFDASTNSAWTGQETTGASAYDTSTVTVSSPVSAGGTVTYAFFTNGTCTSTSTSAGSGDIGSNSSTEGPLGAGDYSFQATYSGDNNYNGSVGPCEKLTVNQGTSTTATVVFDAATNQPWSDNELPGASAYDTSSVTPSSSLIPATGTISYTFFPNSLCTPDTGNGAGTGLALGSHSTSEGPLVTGAYSFQAVYSGDKNYAGSTGPCETFSVGMGSSTTTTTVFDAATNAAWSGHETTGASAYDTSNVTFVPTGGGAPNPTGTITYTFFPNGSCTEGTGTPAGTVQLGSHSDTKGPLAAGTYSFQALYSGDNNYAGSLGACEPLTVQKGTSDVETTVFDAATTAAWTNTETTGASAYDTSTVTVSSPAFAATGTISYVFFPNGSCTADTGSSAGGGLKLGSHSNTEGPLGAGSYSFQAAYSGDSNYAGDSGPCEPLTVNPGTSATATTVFDAATNHPWTNTEVGTPSAYDTSTVSGSSLAFNPTGTVSYTFFHNGNCAPDTGTPAGTGLPLGTHSSTEGPLSQGIYSFQAVYSGDSNYQGSTGTCEMFVLEYPVITASKSSSPVDGSVVQPGDTVTYTITLANAGLLDANGITLTDAVPAGTTYVANSASDGGTLSGSTVSWTNLTVPAGGTKPVSFHVTVNATDTDGQVIPNHAIFPNINTPQDGCITSSDTTEVTCDTNTVTLTVSIPIINVVKSEPTPGNGQTVTAGQSAPITYKLAVTNAGSAVATNVVVTDVIPTGASYVAGSATPSVEATYNSSTKTITWTVPSVPAKSGSTPGEVDLTFQVTVDAADANGSTLTNQAAFTNVHTPSCTAGSTTAVCLTNTVSNPVIVLQTQPAPQVAPTTTVPKHALAFTGLNSRMLTFLAICLVTVGTMLVLIGRRRRPNN